VCLPYIYVQSAQNSNIPTTTKTPTHIGFTASAAVLPRLFHPVHRHAPAIGRACLRNRRPKRSCSGRGRIRFLGSDLRDCLLASSSSSPRLVYLFVGLAGRVIAFNENFVRSIVVSSDRYRQGIASHVRFLLLNYVLHI
jgi:hypothetical protein